MTVTNQITIDLAKKAILPEIDVTQGDSARVAEITLLENGKPWPVPQGAEIVVSYQNARGEGGSYDALADGTPACSATDNVLRVSFPEQVCAVRGRVRVQIGILHEGRQLSVFTLMLRAEGEAAGEKKPGRYVNLSKWLQAYQGLPIINTAQGNPITLLDSLDRPFAGLKVSIQAQAEGVDSLDVGVCKNNVFGGASNRILCTLPCELTFLMAADMKSISFYAPVKQGKLYTIIREGVFTKNMRIGFTDVHPGQIINGQTPCYGLSIIPPPGNFCTTISPVDGWIVCFVGDDSALPYAQQAEKLKILEEETTTIDLPDTCYGGYVDWVEGIYVQTHTLSGEEAVQLAAPVTHKLTGLPEICGLYPITSLSTNGTQLDVSYIADTKNYIDNKLKGLASGV